MLNRLSGWLLYTGGHSLTTATAELHRFDNVSRVENHVNSPHNTQSVFLDNGEIGWLQWTSVYLIEPVESAPLSIEIAPYVITFFPFNGALEDFEHDNSQKIVYTGGESVSETVFLCNIAMTPDGQFAYQHYDNRLWLGRTLNELRAELRRNFIFVS